MTAGGSDAESPAQRLWRPALPSRAAREEGARFALTGVVVAVYYVVATTTLDLVFPFQVALVAGYTSAVALHFALQRLFVWRSPSAFALALRQQLSRYVAVALVQYALTAAITVTVPWAFGISVTVVYVATAVVAAVANFVILRTRIFHRALGAGDAKRQVNDGG